jgi:hypothetical protein
MIKSDIKSEKKGKKTRETMGSNGKEEELICWILLFTFFIFFLGRDLPRNSGNAERMRASARARDRKR